MLRPASGAALHLVLGKPAKEALGAFLAGDGAADVWEWSAYKRGDLLLTILDSKPRVLLCLETARRDSSSGGRYIEVEEVWPLPRLVPVAAIEARLGRRLPGVPGPVGGHLAERLLDALEAELADPTSVHAREGARCHNSGRVRASGLQMIVLKASEGVCCGCGREHLALFGGKGLAALEVHHLRPLGGGDEEVETGPEDLVVVCGACHNLLHSQPSPTLQEVRFEWRPACPAGHRRALRFERTDQPVAEDVISLGCLEPPAGHPLWRCAECGSDWGELAKATDATPAASTVAGASPGSAEQGARGRFLVSIVPSGGTPIEAWSVAEEPREAIRAALERHDGPATATIHDHLAAGRRFASGLITITNE